MIPSFKHGIIASGRPRVSAAAADVTPDAVTWDDLYFEVDCADTRYYQNTAKQITGIDTDIDLKISWSGGPNYIGYKIAASSFGNTTQSSVEDPNYGEFYTNYGYVQLARNGIISNVSNGDYVGFMANYYEAGTITMSVLNNSDSDALISTFDHYYGGDVCSCFLTTSVVNYMGLLDNGPELTAMRMLREHYRNVPGYAEIIQEYYTNSQAIIDAINSSQDPSVEYNYIYNTVIAVMNHVNAEEWQQGHDLYLAMYNDLKKRYLG